MSKKKITSITTQNKSIIDFYSKHTQIDFDQANLLLIHLFEFILNKNNSDESDTSVFTYLKQLEQSVFSLNEQFKLSSQQLTNIQTSVIEMPSQMNNSIASKLSSVREEYIKEIERALQYNQHEQNTSITNLIQNDLATKLKCILDTDMNDKVIDKIQALDDTLKLDIQKCVSEMKKGTSTTDILSSVDATIQSKFDSLQHFLITNQTQLRENELSTRDAIMSIQNHFDRQKNSTFKGIDSENKMETLLNEAFPDASIENKTGQSKSCDFLITRVDKVPIMIENKDYSNNVPIQEVEKFIRDIDHHSCSGIFISQSSGISRKQNFQIDIHNNCVLIYIHNLQYDSDKIKLAVHTIDYLSTIFRADNYDTEELKISHTTLKEINSEYQHFLYQRSSLSETLKKFQKDMSKQINQLEMTSLSSILSKHFASTEATLFKCSHCNVKQFKNAKALAAHTKKCKKESNGSDKEHIEVDTVM